MVTMIPRSKLEPHPDNPRKDLGDLSELSASIKARGILQNLTVVPSPGNTGKYRIVIGHRRFAATALAGYGDDDELPCAIEDMDLPTQVATMLAENMQRNDLTLTDQVGGVQTMMDLGIDARGIAQRTGLSTTTIRKRMKLTGINPGLLTETVNKGATLMDLAKIADLDDDLRDRMLEEFGSTSYKWKLQHAEETQKARKNLPAAREALAKWAKEHDTDPWNIYHDACTHLRDIDLVKYSEASVQRPDDPEDTEYAFCVKDTRIAVYRLGEKDAMKAIEYNRSQYEMRERRRKVLCEQEADVAQQAQQLRDSFIRDYSGREQDKSAAYRFVTHVLLLEGYMSPTEIPKWREFIGSEGKGKKVDEKDNEAMAKHPMKAMVQAAYWKWMSQSGTQFTRCTTWEGEYKRNDGLIELYNDLAGMGYQIADEEWDWLLGKHACYIAPEGMDVT